MITLVFDHTIFSREYAQKNLLTGTLYNSFPEKSREVLRETPAPKSYFSPFFPVFFTKVNQAVSS